MTDTTISSAQNYSESCDEGINKKTEVKLRIYDISNGLVSLLSMQLLGEKLEGLWHTALQIYDFEYFYGGGIVKKLPADVEKDFGIHPVKIISLGFIDINMNDFENYLVTLSNKYIEGNYDIINQNCNHFTNEVCQFLFGFSIPSYIIDLPLKVQKSPFGSTIINMMTQKNMNSENVGNYKSSLWSVQGAVESQSMYGFDEKITNLNVVFFRMHKNKEFSDNASEKEKERVHELINEFKDANNLTNKDLNVALRLIVIIMINVIFHQCLEKCKTFSLDNSNNYRKLLKYRKAENLLNFLDFISDDAVFSENSFLTRKEENIEDNSSLLYRRYSMSEPIAETTTRLFRIINQFKAVIKDLSETFSDDKAKIEKLEQNELSNSFNNTNDIQSNTVELNALRTNITDLKLKYATELSILNEMGFVDNEENLRALEETNGNIDAAVPLLLKE